MKYKIYFDVNDFLEDNDNFIILHNLKEKQIQRYIEIGAIVGRCYMVVVKDKRRIK